MSHVIPDGLAAKGIIFTTVDIVIINNGLVVAGVQRGLACNNYCNRNH